MNYKRLLKKITHKDFMGGAFRYCGCTVNETLGSECMDIHIERNRHILAEFDFTFEIPRFITFHNTGKRTSNCISQNLDAIYGIKIPVYYES